MSYQVLARKYRPQRFDQMMGHAGTRRALINALEKNKLHHTYLLTGTRGVGKTSLARLLAKCLNCETKVTSTPCETCASCVAIQKNQFVDLIEVDAASRTRVEDTQSLLENVQYKPTLGRYKVYLIDEVHMLSTHSFNALLKTLEEPPPHVIFILATTDLQKVPDTIISRCLHFPLKPLSVKEITQQLTEILNQEEIKYDIEALEKVAKLAKGSVRDALSLLEPVILHGDDNRVTLKDVQALFGYIDESDQWALISAIHKGEVNTLKEITHTISTQSIDFEKILDSLIEVLHQIAWVQQLEEAISSENHPISEQVLAFAKAIQPEQVQLYYQIALMGKKDLSFAPTPQLGFEMTLLRMTAFTPLSKSSNTQKQANTPKQPYIPKDDTLVTQKSDKSTTINASKPFDWLELARVLPLTGFLKSLVLNCAMESCQSEEIILALDPRQKVLYSQEREALLQKILSEHLKKDIKLHIRMGSTGKATPATIEAEKLKQQKEAAYQSILSNDSIKAIQKTFDATIQTEAIHLNSEKHYE